MKPLADQAERDRFVRAEGRNISVIAPAGVGKTRAIVERIVALAQRPEDDAADRLSRLVVVTYSVRAAQEMQQRARAAIRQAKVSPRVQRAFQQTYFGTIHSYCVQLLERFGHYLGLPSPLTLLEDPAECWERFLVRGLGDAAGPAEELRDLFHFYAPEKLYALGQEIMPGEVRPVGPLPLLELAPLLDFPLGGLRLNMRQNLERAQAELRRWSAAWARGDRFYPLPKCPDTRLTEFVELWAATFAPLHEWLRQAALAFGRGIANAYAEFRLAEAVMTYEDQVRLARRLLDVPAVRRELADERLSVLLDEAQDTDPRQFEVLLRVAGLRRDAAQPDDQSLCIVGDFQQAIYVPRSDLGVYESIHDEITTGPRGARSQFEVTFRCDAAVIEFVNRIFPSVLHGESGQSMFFPLRGRHDVGEGGVAKWRCPDEPEHAAGAKINAEQRAHHEAQFLAGELKRLGPRGLGAADWSQVAILCPRRNWLRQIAQELRAAGLPVQLHSSDEVRHDRTADAWFTALVWVVTHPEDSFEIAGVLREIFGVADDAMALYTGGDGEQLRLDRENPGPPGEVEEARQILRELSLRAGALPLHRAVEEIVARTGLRARLRAIGEIEREEMEEDLDSLLATVLQQAAQGATLAELARRLRLRLTQSHPDEEEIRDAIQLMTTHKAKGLEWPTVILPYFFRGIEMKEPSYPRLVQGAQGLESIYRDKADYAAAKGFVQERDRQQLQRLLYVACTRARHTLLLIDDATLFDGQRRRGVSSSGELLGFTSGVNRITWEALPEKLPRMKSTGVVAGSAVEKKDAPFSFSRRDLEAARARADAIPRRITPHALARYENADAEPEITLERDDEPAPDHPGILYGTWWHEFIQAVPWEKPEREWGEVFQRFQPRSPDPGRAEREWELFLRSGLADWLREPGRLIHRELPFLWPKDDRTVFEGVMDLAIYTEQDKSWQVIDWKTNRLGEGGKEALAEVYRGQLVAYMEALRGILGGEVKGSLYLTGTGDWIPIE